MSICSRNKNEKVHGDNYIYQRQRDGGTTKAPTSTVFSDFIQMENAREKRIVMFKRFLRKIKYFNHIENKSLTLDFRQKVHSIKEKNSQIIWEHYYIPKAMLQVFKEDNYMGINKKVENIASANMFKDMANGKLDEFYRFVK